MYASVSHFTFVCYHVKWRYFGGSVQHIVCVWHCFHSELWFVCSFICVFGMFLLLITQCCSARHKHIISHRKFITVKVCFMCSLSAENISQILPPNTVCPQKWKQSNEWNECVRVFVLQHKQFHGGKDVDTHHSIVTVPQTHLRVSKRMHLCSDLSE